MTDTGRVPEPGETRLSRVRRVAWTAFGPARYVVNMFLACIAVALEVYYSVCGGSCSYLRGNLVGVPLQYVGIGYMILIVFLSILRTDTLLSMLLSAGVGIELYLVGFQLWYHTYCPYCLAFGGVVLVLFLLNLNRTRKWLTIVSMALALILFSLFFEGSVTPSYAEETIAPSFGQGPVSVRLYTDYFCPPCRAMEPEVEPLLAELVKKNRINLTFIDTPFYQYSSLYTKHYLYAMNEKREFEHALATRAVLIESAKQDIGEPARVQVYLADKGIRIKPFDTKSILDVFIKYMKEDGVSSTPTCVIENSGKKEKASGKAEIINSLKALK